jgi:hypothetical protein
MATPYDLCPTLCGPLKPGAVQNIIRVNLYLKNERTRETTRFD